MKGEGPKEGGTDGESTEGGAKGEREGPREGESTEGGAKGGRGQGREGALIMGFDQRKSEGYFIEYRIDKYYLLHVPVPYRLPVDSVVKPFSMVL